MTEEDDIRVAMRATINRLRLALEFYARECAWHGPNQKNAGTDPFTPADAAYVLDATRDHGSIARKALI